MSISVQLKAKRRWWVTLLIIEVVYVLAEFAFNAALLDVASGVNDAEGALDTVEYVGRTLSGFGLALLVLGLFQRKQTVFKTSHQLLKFMLISLVCVPLMFFGQKLAIDYFLVKPTDGESRVKASLVLLLKQGLERNAVAFKGMPESADIAEKTPAEKTFLAVFGSLLMSDQSLMKKVESQRGAIIEQVSARIAEQQTAANYPAYQEMTRKINEAWIEYRDASNEALHNLNSADRTAQKAWREASPQFEKAWQDYRQARKNYYAEVRTQVREIFPDLQRAVEGYYDCFTSLCRSRIQSRYNRAIENKLGFGRKIEMKEWCPTVKKKFNGCLKSVDQATRVILKHTSSDFYSRSGYSWSVNSRQKWFKETKTRRAIFNKLEFIPERYWAGDKAGFIKATIAHHKRLIANEFKKGMSRAQGQRVDIEPGLSYSAFVKSDFIQSQIKQAMGKAYRRGLKMNHSRSSFKRKVIWPSVKSAAEQQKRLFAEGVVSLAEGGKQQRKGENAMRALIVPPIALVLSLFFSLFSLAKACVRLFEIVTMMKPQAWHLYAKRGVLVVAVAAIILVPLSLPQNALVNSKVTRFLIKETAKHQPPLVAGALSWVLSAEPIFNPLGAATLSYLPSWDKVEDSSRQIGDKATQTVSNIRSEKYPGCDYHYQTNYDVEIALYRLDSLWYLPGTENERPYELERELKRFQDANGIRETGKPDKATLQLIFCKLLPAVDNDTSEQVSA